MIKVMSAHVDLNVVIIISTLLSVLNEYNPFEGFKVKNDLKIIYLIFNSTLLRP